MPIAILSVMAAGALAAAFADVRTRRIPNVLTGALAAIALAAGVATGLAGVATAMLVMLVAFTAGTLAFSAGWLGGGDVKLLAACCGFAGFPGSIELVLYILIAGGLVSVAEAMRARRLRGVLSGAYHATLGQRPQTPSTVPYGVAIAAGAAAYTLSVFPVFHFLRLPL